MPVTASEAAQHIHSMNGRIRRPLPGWLSKNSPGVYIYNIYPKRHSIGLGALGTWHIPACEEGAQFSEPLVVPGVFGDEFDLADGQGNMGTNPVDGRRLAEDVIGLRSSVTKCDLMTNNLEWWGCFISDHASKTAEANQHLPEKERKPVAPSAEELRVARKKLNEFMSLILKDGDNMNSKDSTKQYLVPQHFEAASYLKQVRNWNTEPEQRAECPGCGSNIKVGIAKCAHCGAILDRQKAISLGLLPPDPMIAPETIPVLDTPRTPPARK